MQKEMPRSVLHKKSCTGINNSWGKKEGVAEKNDKITMQKRGLRNASGMTSALVKL